MEEFSRPARSRAFPGGLVGVVAGGGGLGRPQRAQARASPVLPTRRQGTPRAAESWVRVMSSRNTSSPARSMLVERSTSSPRSRPWRCFRMSWPVRSPVTFTVPPKKSFFTGTRSILKLWHFRRHPSSISWKKAQPPSPVGMVTFRVTSGRSRSWRAQVSSSSRLRSMPTPFSIWGKSS